MAKRKKKKSAKNSGDTKYIIRHTAAASLIGAAVFFALCALSALAAFKKDADPQYFKIIFIAVSGISGLICGFAAVLPVKRNGLILGMISVIPAFFIIFTVITVINRSPVSAVGWASLGAITLGGGLGGILGNKK